MEFNGENILSSYSKAVQQLPQISEMAEKINQKDIHTIYLVGSGGAFTKYVDSRATLLKIMDAKIVITTPDELWNVYHDQLDSHSLIVFGTESGETKDLISALEKIKAAHLNITVVGQIGSDDTVIDQKKLYDYRISSCATDVHLVTFGWLMILLSQKFIEEELLVMQKSFAQSGKIIVTGLKKVFTAAKEMVNGVDLNQPQMWLTSGNLWGEVCCFCNYMLEEVQRIPAQGVHSSEFFHGPFELVEKGVPVFVVLNSGATRFEDVRVLNFLKKYTDQFFSMDMQEFDTSGLHPVVANFVECAALSEYFDTLLNLYTERTGRSVKTRRYYKIVEY
ncbi:MAG TPA: SIS domain-containing protein [Ligilactobacillus acidipiscis]|uniref:SIS domain-containing protein n=1 Tax=Ligilactobacillus acidipiscis TaxID=89059 RepID=A0A921F628_9LACO|nr:SIS domain-containing protein [Ligilactobacillus acidipiscis]